MNDLLLDSNHDLDTSRFDLQIVQGADAVRQNILVKLRLWVGEWFLDTEAGTPWLEDVLGKRVSLAGAIAAIRASILEVDGVDGLGNFSYNFNRQSRVLQYDFEASTPYGIIRVSA